MPMIKSATATHFPTFNLSQRVAMRAIYFKIQHFLQTNNSIAAPEKIRQIEKSLCDFKEKNLIKPLNYCANDAEHSGHSIPKIEKHV